MLFSVDQIYSSKNKCKMLLLTRKVLEALLIWLVMMSMIKTKYSLDLRSREWLASINIYLKFSVPKDVAP
jgi:hypothetical protein